MEVWSREHIPLQCSLGLRQQLGESGRPDRNVWPTFHEGSIDMRHETALGLASRLPKTRVCASGQVEQLERATSNQNAATVIKSAQCPSPFPFPLRQNLIAEFSCKTNDSV